MIPEQALIDSARWYLQLDRFTEDQILEWKIAKAESETLAPDDFIDRVASDDPTVGGGSTAALAGALAAALAAMVARTTLGKKKYADVQQTMQAATAESDALRAELARTIDADSAAFQRVMEAYRLDKDDPVRAVAIQSALKHAAEVPLRTAELAVRALEQLRVVAGQGNVNAATDAAAGAHMALAAVEAAALNVLVNANGLEDMVATAELREAVTALRERGRTLAAEVLALTASRSGLS
jgi:formiminotetrahydrofolate cyclodeaminase